MKKQGGCTSCKPTSNESHKMKMLINYFPFLKNDYRELQENEIENPEVFKELFSDTLIELGKLKALYQYQQLKKTKS